MPSSPASKPDLARTSRARRAAAWLEVGAWVAVVWWLGGGDFGAPTTSRYLEPLLRWLLPDLSGADRMALAAAIRKLAHPAVYAVLAALAYRATRLSGVPRPLRAAALAFALAVAVAALDETRQALLPARTGAFFDVVLDASGAAGILGLFVLASRRRRPPLEGA